MPLLRLSNKRVYTTVEDINRIVAPLQVGTFALDDAFRAKVAAFRQPISQADAMEVLAHLDPQVPAMVGKEGFRYRRVGNVAPRADEEGSFFFVTRDEESPGDAAPTSRSKKEIDDYLIPHHVQVNDWHFVFSGAIIKGVQLADGVQGIVYCRAGEWVRLNPTILNWPVFPYGEATVAVSYFDRPFAGGSFQMDLKPDVKVLPGLDY